MKIEQEAANYNPWGKGGGGAPLRDSTGHLVGKPSSHTVHVHIASLKKHNFIDCYTSLSEIQNLHNR